MASLTRFSRRLCSTTGLGSNLTCPTVHMQTYQKYNVVVEGVFHEVSQNWGRIFMRSNNNGKISFNEFCTMMSAIEYDESRHTLSVQKMDVDASGSIDSNEFAKVAVIIQKYAK